MSLPPGVRDQQAQLNRTYLLPELEAPAQAQARAELNREHLLGPLPELAAPARRGPLGLLAGRLRRAIGAAVRELVAPKLAAQERINAQQVRLLNGLTERLGALVATQREFNAQAVRLLNFLIETQDQDSELLRKLRFRAVELEKRIDEAVALHHETTVLAEQIELLKRRAETK
ncbi:MAG TPA: hypothetical protein VGB99_09975 [Acidobacteriota bacterium]